MNAFPGQFDAALVWSRIAADPWLYLATAGLIFATSYLLLMLLTRVGDVKPGIQSLGLSAVIHLVMALFWGTLVIPQPKGQPRPVKPVVIRKVIMQEEISPEHAGQGDEAVWDRLPTTTPSEVTRLETLPDVTAPADAPQKTAATVEPLTGRLPELALPPTEIPPDTPQAMKATEAPKRAAADRQIDADEETAESRPDLVLSNTVPQRSTAEQTGAATPAAEQPQRTGAEQPAASVAVRPAPAMTADPLLDDAAPVKRSVSGEQRSTKTGPAKTAMSIDDTGLPSDTPAADAGAGAPAPSRFTRSGRPSQRNDVVGNSLERGRTTARPDGDNPIAPGLVALTPNGLNDVGMAGPRPGLSQPKLGAIPQRESARVPDTYRLRNLPQRKSMATKLGATEESERAVELSLRWLALHQNPAGYWDADGFHANCPADDRCWGPAGLGNPAEAEENRKAFDPVARQTAGKSSDSGLTALVVLAFLGAGYTHEEGQYADQVDRAIRWIIRNQREDGFLGAGAGRYDQMYCHGMATYALGEACGMMADPHADPQLREALSKAIRYIISAQHPGDGGWRYIPGQEEGDMSMFGWQLMALKSAEIAGLEIPGETRTGMVTFLKRISQGENKGLAAYRFGEQPKPSMTAEALFSRQMLGMKRNNPTTLEAITYLQKHPPRLETQDLYYWYYGTLAVYQYGGEPWRDWNDRLRDTLVTMQRKTGHAAGSWDPRDGWSRQGGRIYSTALSTLCLEVYYRFLPLYQLHEEPDPTKM